MLKVAVIIQNVTATFNVSQSDYEICNHLTATFKMWLQNSKSNRKIYKYDGQF